MIHAAEAAGSDGCGAARMRAILSCVDVEALAAAWKRRRAGRQAQLEERASRARDAARRAAQVLTDEFGAERVWMFGSLAWGRVHERSDLDLAVEGLAPERFSAALSRVSGIAGEQVDLVPLESCAESLRRRVLEHGIRVDDR